MIGNAPIGVLHEDLRMACMGALHLSRETRRDFALTRSWDASARQFIGHINRVVIATSASPARLESGRMALTAARNRAS